MGRYMGAFENFSVVAHSPGRVRLYLPALRHSSGCKAAVAAALHGRRSVRAAYPNTITGRLLIWFDPALSLDALLSELGLAKPAQATARAASPAAPGGRPPACGHPAPPLYAAWHLRPARAALAYFGSSTERGLTQAEAARRLRAAPPAAAPSRAPSALALLRRQFRSLPIVLLALAALLSVATGGLAEAAGIAAVLALNGGIGWFAERRAEAAIASLSELIDAGVKVRRDGLLHDIDSAQLVVGDVLPLAPGVRVAADLRLLEADGLQLDEAPLTGESARVDKQAAPLRAPAPLAERSNMVYRGTTVLAGSGVGLAVGVGARTEMGAVQALTRGAARPQTPMQRQLDHLGKQLVWAGLAACAGVFVLGLARGYRPLAMFKTALSLAIAAVPEGLPAVATSALARGLVRMRARQVLIRRLHAVETIGAIQVVCLDKTGTLTMNRMSAVALRSACRRLPLAPPACGGAEASDLQRLLQVCVLCNQSQAASAQPAPSDGSATENALITLAVQAGVKPGALRAAFPLLATELRAEGRNYMRTTHAGAGPAGRLVAVKGNPSEVLALCDRYLDGAGALPLDDRMRARILRQNRAMARSRLRVLGFAHAECAAGDEAATALTWTGLVGLADPLRPGVDQLVAGFHAAGVRTVMLTGDQVETAGGIGRALRLNRGGELHIVDAGQLERTPPDQLPALAARADVFARVSPAHKLRIVQALQQSGQVVAMTGDGINDGPALRAADIGVAMGGGSELALSAADIALKDDQLQALLEAVREGRTISSNIRKTLHFLLSSNLSEILMVLGAVAIGGGRPLAPGQLLWLNVLTDLAPALALAAAPAEDDMLARTPRDPRAPIVGPGQLRRYAGEAAALAGGALGAYLYGVARHGAGAQASSIGFNTLVYGQLLHALFCRSGNGKAPHPSLKAAVVASASLQLAVTLLPAGRRLLNLAPPGMGDALAIAAGAALPYWWHGWHASRRRPQ